jgi:hypothetical protein
MNESYNFKIVIISRYGEGDFSHKALHITLFKTQSQVWWFMPVIPTSQKAETGRWQFEASLGKKLLRPHLNKKSWVWRCTPDIPVTQEL